MPALTAGIAALAGDPDAGPDAVASWLAKIGAVRPAIGALERALLIADTIDPDGSARELAVGQLPLQPWIGTPATTPPPARRGWVIDAR